MNTPYFQNHRCIKTTVLVGLLLLAAIASNAAVASFQVYNTGVNGAGGLLANETIDSHYSIISAPSPYNTAYTGNGLDTTGPMPWLDDGPNSRWIGVTPWMAEWVPVGNYVFQTTFSLTGFDPTTASLALQIASDNVCRVYLNGNDTGITTGSEAFTSFSNFAISTGFVNGMNTLDFHVNNATTPGAQTHNPMGLRVELSGSASVIPEPTALGMTGIAFAVLVSFRRVRRI